MTKTRLSKSDWLAGAFDMLVAKGIEQVKIAPLAAQLAVTKGSFYWHFKDRQALLTDMLNSWHQQKTLDVITYVDDIADDAEDRLMALMQGSIMAKRSNKVEAAIRSWALADKTVLKKVKEVDEQRISYVTQLLQQLGFDDTTALNRARVVCFSHTGVYWMGKNLDKAQLLMLVKDLHKMTVAR